MCWFAWRGRELQPLLRDNRDKPKISDHWAASLQLLTLCSHQQRDVTAVTSPLAVGGSISKPWGQALKVTSRWPAGQEGDSLSLLCSCEIPQLQGCLQLWDSQHKGIVARLE